MASYQFAGGHKAYAAAEQKTFPTQSEESVTTQPSVVSPASSSKPSPYRPVQSCQFCRRRKIRCDKAIPNCTQCLKTHAECVYPLRKPRKTNSSLPTATGPQDREEQLLKRIGKLESAIQGLKAQSAQTAATPDAEIADPLGKLTIGKPYLNDGFWGSNELNELLADSTEESDSENEEASPPINTARGTGFIFGVSPIFEDLSSFHPPTSQVLHYWQVYLENCECLLKLIHTPTVNMIVNNAVRSKFYCLDESDELLMFCFYFAAITSLTDGEVLCQFGQERASLLERYELAIKHGLTRARFLQTQDLKVLQALVLYLTCLPNADPAVSAVVWNMLGLAFRIAQSMAIDRDGEIFNLKPFDTELRRRLWYHLLFLDVRGAEARGCLSAILHYDTRPPTNINDSDIYPDMTEYPKPAMELTEMTVPLMRIEAARLGRRLHATGFRDTVLSPGEKQLLIEKVQKDINDKFVRYCQGAGPFYEYTFKVVNMILRRSNLIVFQDRIRTASQMDRDWLFDVCLQIIEFYQELNGNITCRRWFWLLKIYTQWHAIAFVLKELCDRAPGSSPDVERAWRVVDAACDEWKPPPDSQGSLVYDSIRKLLAKARRRRDRHYHASGESSVSPTSLDSSSGLSPQFTILSSSSSAPQPQQFSRDVPYVFPDNYNGAIFDTLPTGRDISIGLDADLNIGIGGGIRDDEQIPIFDAQMMPPLEELTSLPEWFFPSMNGPPVQGFDMGYFNSDDVVNFPTS